MKTTDHPTSQCRGSGLYPPLQKDYPRRSNGLWDTFDSKTYVIFCSLCSTLERGWLNSLARKRGLWSWHCIFSAPSTVIRPTFYPGWESPFLCLLFSIRRHIFSVHFLLLNQLIIFYVLHIFHCRFWPERFQLSSRFQSLHCTPSRRWSRYAIISNTIFTFWNLEEIDQKGESVYFGCL